MSGTKRPADPSGGGRGGNGGRNTPGGRGFGGRSSASFRDDQSVVPGDAGGHGAAGGSHSRRGSAGSGHSESERGTTEGLLFGRDGSSSGGGHSGRHGAGAGLSGTDNSYFRREGSSSPVPDDTFAISPTSSNSSLPSSSSSPISPNPHHRNLDSSMSTMPFFPESVTSSASSYQGIFGSISPSSLPSATPDGMNRYPSVSPSPPSSPFGMNRSPSQSPSPPRSPSFSPSRMSSDSLRPLPDPGLARGILGQAALVQFLNTFKFPHHQCAWYKAEVRKLQDLGDCDLKVDFDHLLDADPDLAQVVCNRQRSGDMWLRNAAILFLNGNGLKTQEGKISFFNVPRSIRTARDTLTYPTVPLVWPNKLFKGQAEVVSCSFYGSEICSAIIDAVFEWLSNGKSSKGNLTLDGILIMERSEGLKAIITQKAEVDGNASDEDKALDVNGIWRLIEPFFIWGGQLPLFFKELKHDLLGCTAKDVRNDSFWEYLRFFPGFVSSMGRRNFESGLYQIVKEFYLHRSIQFQAIFAEPPMRSDWRPLVIHDPLLMKNYNYQKNKGNDQFGAVDGQEGTEMSKLQVDGADLKREKTDLGKVENNANLKREENVDLEKVEENANQFGAADGQEGSEMSKIELDSADLEREKTDLGKFEKNASLKREENADREEAADPEEFELDDNDPHENTTWSLLGSGRHHNQHPKGNFQDLDETELYAANLLPYLPKMIRNLLDKCEMGGRFASIWSCYKSSKMDPRRLPPI